jgi:hypothetical protein
MLPKRIIPPLYKNTSISKIIGALPRGGGVGSSGLVLPSVDTVAHVTSVLSVSQGLMDLVVATKRSDSGGSGTADPPSPPPFLNQALGAVALGHGISLHFLLIRKSSPLIAIGTSLLPRLALSFYWLVANRNRHPFVSRAVKVNTVMMSWVCLSVLTGIGNPAIAARVFTTVACLKGLFLALAPVAACAEILRNQCVLVRRATSYRPRSRRALDTYWRVYGSVGLWHCPSSHGSGEWRLPFGLDSGWSFAASALASARPGPLGAAAGTHASVG